MGQSKFFLTTKRLGFSTWQAEQMPEASQLWGNSQVTSLISQSGFSTEEIEKRLSKEIAFQDSVFYQYWPIYFLANNKFCGCCGFHPLSDDRAELGYHLVPEFWRMGLATEAAEAAIEFAFSNLKITKIVAGHHPENLSSGKVLKKLGFQNIENQYYKPTGLMHPTYELKKNQSP